MHNFFTLFYTHKYQIYDVTGLKSWVKVSSPYIPKPNQRNENQLNLSCLISGLSDNLMIKINRGFIYADCSQPITSDKLIPCSESSLEGSFNLYDFDLTNASSITKTKYDVLNNDVDNVYPFYNSFLNANYQNISIISKDNINDISISNIPYGNKTLERYNGSTLLSYSVDNNLDVGYLPNYCLNNDINADFNSTVDLYSWSISLLSLIEQKEDLLLYQCLVYIIKSFELNYQNTSKNGLPNTIKEQYLNYNLTRSVINNCWAGYAILQSVGYLCNKATVNITNISSQIKTVLESIAKLIDECTINDTLTVGYDEYGGKIDKLDIYATYLADIYLNQYLCYFYDMSLLYKHNLIHKFCISDIYTDYKVLDYYVNNIMQLCIAKSLWISYFNRDINLLEDIFVDVKANISLFNSEEYDINLLCFLNLRFKNADLISTLIPELKIENLYTLYEGLYIRKDKLNLTKFLYLLDSSWGFLLHNSVSVFNPIPYNMKTDVINLETLDLLRSLTNSWPTGSNWTSYTSIYDKTTAIGSIFNSIAHITTQWSLLRHYIMDSTSCNTSQGNALDRWGEVLNFHRPQYQADYYYRDSLVMILNRTAPNKKNLEVFIKDFLEDESIKILTNKFPNIYYKDSNNNWVYREWKGNKEDIDLINSQLNSKNEPCFYLPNSVGNMSLVPLHNFTSQVNLYSENIDLNTSIIFANKITAGIKCNIYKVKTYLSNVTSLYTDFSINTI